MKHRSSYDNVDILVPISLQGSRFIVGKEGATLGRKQTNTIAFSHESNGTVMGIDASISGDHARIGYDEAGDFLYIMDGTPTKVSRGPSGGNGASNEAMIVR